MKIKIVMMVIILIMMDVLQLVELNRIQDAIMDSLQFAIVHLIT